MSRSLIRPILAFAVITAVAGCVTEPEFTPPPLPSSVSGSGVPYSSYGPGFYYGAGPTYYYGSPGYYDPRYPGYPAYSPFYYGPGMVTTYPYGPYYYPYPRYVGVPCVDSNHDGRCDRHPGKHDGDHPQQWPGHGDQGHGVRDRDGDHDGQQPHGDGGAPMTERRYVPLTPVVPHLVPPAGVQPSMPLPPPARPPQSPATGTDPGRKDPRSGHHHGSRDDTVPRPQQP